MTGSAEEVVRRKFTDLLDSWNFAVLDELVSDDVVAQDPSWGKPRLGKRAYREAAEQFAAAFPEMAFTIEDQVVAGDTVVTRWTATGRHGGDLQGMPATGKRVAFSGIDIHRVRDGKIADEYGQWDALGLMRQLGAMP